MQGTMTLEDFFTLTEMKDGLISPARVKELVNEMQKEKFGFAKNVCESTRQWCAVASTIAATENKDCLDLFFQLDGLCYFDTWLKDAQKFGNESGESIVEESITALLGAIEKLCVDNHKLVSSGILTTVENFMSHNSSRVQDKARALCDSWKQNSDSNLDPQDVEKAEEVCEEQMNLISNLGEDHERRDSSSHDIEEENVEEPAGDETMPSICSETLQHEAVESINVRTSEKPLDHTSMKEGNLEEQLDVVNSNEHDDAKVEPDMEEDFDAKEVVVFPSIDVKTDVCEGKGEMENSKLPNSWRNTCTDQSDECSTDVLQKSSSSEQILGISDDPTAYLSRIADTGASEESNEHDTDETRDNLGHDSNISRSAVNNAKDPDVIDKRSEIELDYGIIDPLEVARQVAIEVEREVDCREPSCSSSERTSGGRGVRLAKSPDSINGKMGLVIHGPSKDMPTGPNLSAVPGDQENCKHDMDGSLVTEATQKTESNTDERICGFDLNEDVLSDDMDHKTDPVSAPISVVSASRAAAATGLPSSPLQFEGAFGWKGSAETSAFRPAPPRRISEGAASGSLNNSSQRQGCLDFDLNVADSEDDRTENSSVLPSGDYFVEASPKRSDPLPFDLNHVSDGGEVPPHWRNEGRVLQHLNGRRSPSHSSSSSSMQPSLRNIDLNDQPSLFNDYLSDPAFIGKSSQTLTTSGGLNPGENVISIMGARVEVGREDYVPQTRPSPNGRISALPFAQSPIYGYNGPLSGSTVPFSSAMYGLGSHIPYMVDSRGSPVMPQLLGSVSALPPVFSQPPFIMSVTNAPSGSNGVGPLRHNFDLNSGMMMEGGGNRDAGGLTLRQLFNSGQGRSVDEHFRGNSQPTSSSGNGVKRREPDGGWESYPYNYKNHQPPWK